MEYHFDQYPRNTTTACSKVCRNCGVYWPGIYGTFAAGIEAKPTEPEQTGTDENFCQINRFKLFCIYRSSRTNRQSKSLNKIRRQALLNVFNYSTEMKITLMLRIPMQCEPVHHRQNLMFPIRLTNHFCSKSNMRWNRKQHSSKQRWLQQIR